MTWAEVRERLIYLSALGDSWDGSGSDAPNRDALEQAEGVTWILEDREISGPDAVCAGYSRNVYMEWYDQYRYVELDFLANDIQVYSKPVSDVLAIAIRRALELT